MGSVIRNGLVIDPTNNINAKLDLFIEDGLIVAHGKTPKDFNAEHEIDASNLIVSPGLIDLRARLREPGLEYKATIESEITAAAHAGITTLCVPPDTNPVIDTPAMAEFMQEQALQIGKTFIHPLGAMTHKLEGEQLTDMAALAEAGCVGISNALEPVRNTLIMRRAMQYASTFDLTVFLYSQDPWLQGNGCVHEGAISTRLGLPAIPEAAEIVGLARDLALVETTGVRAHFCNISSARAVEMISEAQQHGLPVTADVSVHHLHLTENDIGSFDTLYHVIPPLRTEHDKQALQQAVANGTIRAICSDHQPHEADAKLFPFGESEPGISGLETLLPLTLKLVDNKILDLPTAIASLTHYPAEILGIDAGQLAVGASADICIIDPKMNWQLTEDTMLSKGKNNPYLNQTLKGKVVKTLINGQLVQI